MTTFASYVRVVQGMLASYIPRSFIFVGKLEGNLCDGLMRMLRVAKLNKKLIPCLV